MKKKLVFFVFAVAGARLFSLDVDTGLGVNFGYNYSSLKTIKDSANYEQSYGAGGIGAFMFVDATYIEGSLNFFFTNTSLKHNDEMALYRGFSGDYNLNGVYIGLGLLLKYPFHLTRFVLYPLAGFEGNICLSQSFSKSYDTYDDSKEGFAYGVPSGWNAFYFRFGVGGDYLISDNLFLRGEFLLNIKLPNGLDKAYIENADFKEAGFETPQFFGMGVSFRIALGFKVSHILGYTTPWREAPPKPPKSADKDTQNQKKTPPKPPPRKPRDPNVYVPQD